MFARVSAFVIWSLVAATVVFWVFRFAVNAPQAPTYAVAVGKSAVVRGDLTRLFGAPPAAAVIVEQAAEAPSRFRLVGVMAPRSARAREAAGHGLALIAIDGKPAKAYAVGAQIGDDFVLQSVGLRTASIGPAQGEPSVLLELPVLPAAATGVLPVPGAPAAAGGGAPVPPANSMRVAPPAVQGAVSPAAAGVAMPIATPPQLPTAGPQVVPPAPPAAENFRPQ